MRETLEVREGPVIDSPPAKPLRLGVAAALIALAAGGYGLAFATQWGAPAILLSLACLFILGSMRTPRQSFYAGLVAGVAVYSPHLLFFGSIFGAPAFALWLVAGLPIAVFVLLLHLARQKLGPARASWLTPVLWTGVEYFRSECYYLKFAWLLPGQVVSFLPGVRLERIGVYGLGFIFASAATLVVGRSTWVRILGCAATVLLAVLMYVPSPPPQETDSNLHVAGIQLEEAEDHRAAEFVDQLAIAHPEAQILVLSEYTFAGPVPEIVRDVVRKHRRYLVAGGTKLLPGDRFYDIAYVIGPDGNDVFEQIKSVPVQLMDDGLPAPDRHVWESPWGKIGVAVCYDVSYARVMDDFVRQGARGLIIPTMDVMKWGAYERRMLHGRLAPVRSAEYGIPVFGVWSSGESQLVDKAGRVIASAPYPGQGAIIAGPFSLNSAGHIPPDRWLATGSLTATGLFMLWLSIYRKTGPWIALGRRSNSAGDYV